MSSTRVIRYTETSSYAPPVFLTEGSQPITCTQDAPNWPLFAGPYRQYFYSGNELQSYNGIPTSRCWSKITGTMSVSWSSSPPAGVLVSVEVETAARDPVVINGSSSSYGASLPSPRYITGADVEKQPSGIPAGFNNFSTVEASRAVADQRVSGSGNYNFNVSLPNATFSGSIQRNWEGVNHSIDGLDGDTAPNISITSTLIPDPVYVFDAGADLQSSFSLAVDSVSVITGVEATLSSNFSISFTGNTKFATTKTLSTKCELLSTTNNFTFATASISSAFSQSQTPTLITDITKTLSSTTSQTASGQMIFGIVGDYTWDSLTDTWNNWPFNSWNRSYNVIGVFDIDETLSFKPSAIVTLTGIFDLDENVAFNQPANATLSSIFSSSFTAQGIIDQGSNITSNFTTTALAHAIYDQLIEFDGVLSAQLIANLIIGSLLLTPSSQFTLASSPTFKPGGEVDMSAAFEILDKLGNMIYGPDVDLSVLYSQLSLGSILQSADFYNTFKILQETRKLLIAIEKRQHIISEEKRLNIIKAESRNFLVPEETRRFKLKVAPVTNRFTTPKVRSPQ